ncbi:MAG: hypothetical protein KAT15_10275 [Bacteroidales bacterium]|nr:hypothetical protein [Bacteroidales bacterium]
MAERANRSKAYAYLRELIYELFYRFPVSSRKLLGIKPAVNPKAMALFSSSYLSLYRISGEQDHFEKSLECLNWLLENPATTETGMGWGYSFDWQSRMLIPANTPNGIVTTAAGEAIWQHYLLYKDQKYLDYCLEVADFLYALPFDSLDENKICYSYTPLFINHVHNLNLFVAEFLIKTGMEIKKSDWIEAGNKAVNYTLSDQRKDGSFDYNGPPEKPQNFIDHYHTGFVLRMLYSIWKLTGREDVMQSLEKCLYHYTANFFIDDRIPKLLPHRKYRIDIHSCAEAVYCLSELSVQFPQHMGLARNVLSWTLENLQDISGYFYYGLLKSRFTGRVYRSRISYIRWSQAWMLKALSAYAENTDTLNES